MIFASVPVLQSPDALRDSWKHWTGCGIELMIVDNTIDGSWRELARKQGWNYLTFGTNIGVPASWNLARAWVIDKTLYAHDMLFLFSSSVEWLDGLDGVLDQLTTAANWKGCQTQWGPHGIAWSRKVLETVGTWDESYYPGYSSDTDYFYRCILEDILVPGPDAMPQIETRSPQPPDGRCITDLGLISHSAASRDLYIAKWGGEPGFETFTTPFNTGLPSWWWTPCHRPGGMRHVNLGESTYR